MTRPVGGVLLALERAEQNRRQQKNCGFQVPVTSFFTP